MCLWLYSPMFESEDGRPRRALAAALAASALLVVAAVAVRVVGRPLVPVWLIFVSGLGALAGLAALIWRRREAAADAAADGASDGSAASWSQAPTAIVTTGVILAAAGFMLAIAAFMGLKDGGPAESRPDCEFPLNNKGAGTCVDEATYHRAGASEQSLFLSVVAAFIACETVAFAGMKDTGRASPIWVEGTREADWD